MVQHSQAYIHGFYFCLHILQGFFYFYNWGCVCHCAWMLIWFCLNLLQFLTYKSVIFVHFFHGCTKIVKMRWKFLKLFWLVSILISNLTHTRVYHSLWFRYFIKSWSEFIIHFFENWSGLREILLDKLSGRSCRLDSGSPLLVISFCLDFKLICYSFTL